MVSYRKNRWTTEEEETLLAGIDKYGTGKWMDIKEDPLFADELTDRTNVDLKDKWRNLKNKERSVNQKVNSASSYVVKNETSHDSNVDAIVLETIGFIGDGYISDILREIEKEYDEIPQNFRKVLSESLRGLVSQGKIVKVRNRYKISEVENNKYQVAAEEAAIRVADAHNKELIATESMREVKRMKKLAKESQMMLDISLDMHEQCARGYTVHL